VAAPDAQTLACAVAGDTAALADLLRAHGPLIRDALRIDPRWRSVLEPEDVMQVTYLEAFLRIRDFDVNSASFGTWLRHIAENNLRDAIKQLGRKKRPQPHRRLSEPAAGSLPADDSCAALLERLCLTNSTPSSHARRREASAAVMAALGKLPADYADAVRLYDLEGRSIAETAAAMHRSAGAVHMLRARAHERLRELLQPHMRSSV